MITYKNYEITQQQIQAHMESALCWANMWLGLKGCSVSSTANELSAQDIWECSQLDFSALILNTPLCYKLLLLSQLHTSLPLFLFNTASGDSKRLPHPTFSVLYFLGLSQGLSQLLQPSQILAYVSTSLALPVLNSLKEQRISSKEAHQTLLPETSLWCTLSQDSLSPPFCSWWCKMEPASGETHGGTKQPWQGLVLLF